MQCKRRNKPTATGDGIKKTSEKEEQKVKAHYLSSRFKNKILKPTDMRTYSKDFEKQWNKLMYNFFDYLPTKYKQASKKDWEIRRLIWDFKDGKRSLSVAKMVAEKLIQFYGVDAKNIVFACIPASSEQRNFTRYKVFADEVCRLSGAVNAFDHIHVHGERLAIHETKCSKNLENVQTIDFDKEFFNGKKILVFDDILTQGYSYAKFSCALERFGASVIGGFFLGKTLLLN